MKIKLKTEEERFDQLMEKGKKLEKWHKVFLLFPRLIDNHLVWLEYVEQRYNCGIENKRNFEYIEDARINHFYGPVWLTKKDKQYRFIKKTNWRERINNQ